MNRRRLVQRDRLTSIVLATLAAIWALAVVVLAWGDSGGEPLIGAVCVSLPAFALLIGAGAMWPSADARQDPRQPPKFPSR